MANRHKDSRYEYAARRFEEWADWRIQGGWHYASRGEYMGHAARSTAYTHSDPVMMMLMVSERIDNRQQQTDIIFRDLPGQEQDYIAMRYVLKYKPMAMLIDRMHAQRWGEDFTQWGGVERGSDKYINACEYRSKVLHKSACDHLLKSIKSLQPMIAARAKARQKEEALRLDAPLPI